MKNSFSLISDLHIKEKSSEASVLFENFFHHPLVQKSDEVILLGDIFEFLVGSHIENFKLFEKELKCIKESLKAQRLTWVEGLSLIHI